MKKSISTDRAPEAIGPYSQAVEVSSSKMLFCSGQIPIDPAKEGLIEGSIAEQTRQVMENIKAIFLAAGYEMDQIVKTTIYLTDISSFPEVNKVYASFFCDTFPARATVQVAALPLGALVEIEAIACK